MPTATSNGTFSKTPDPTATGPDDATPAVPGVVRRRGLLFALAAVLMLATAVLAFVMILKWHQGSYLASLGLLIVVLLLMRVSTVILKRVWPAPARATPEPATAPASTVDQATP